VNIQNRPGGEAGPGLGSEEGTKMSIRKALEREGYSFEYERRRGNDRIEVWTNKKAKMAVRIEWMRMGEED